MFMLDFTSRFQYLESVEMLSNKEDFKVLLEFHNPGFRFLAVERGEDSQESI